MSGNNLDEEMDIRIAKASNAFGALQNFVFSDYYFSVQTKWHVYQACVLPIFLYGSKC